MRRIAYILVILLPWPLRRVLLTRFWRYVIHPTARIGISFIMPTKLVMGKNSRIGHLTVCKGLDLLCMGEYSRIGNGNWISGMPSSEKRHFVHQTGQRIPQLIVGDHAAITHRHIIDCTNSVQIGRFTTMAGYASQILTHSIDLHASRQSSAPVIIGSYCFVGTAAVILGGSNLPDYSVLGAKSLLNKSFDEGYKIYGGVPAREVQQISDSAEYFHRQEGFIV